MKSPKNARKKRVKEKLKRPKIILRPIKSNKKFKKRSIWTRLPNTSNGNGIGSNKKEELS